MPLLSDVGIPGGDPDGPRTLPTVREAPVYKHAAHRASSLGLFVSLALAVAFASRSLTGLIVLAGVYTAVFAALRWAVLREKDWARPVAVAAFAVVGLLMIVSAVGAGAMLLGREGAVSAEVIITMLIWLGGGICFLVFPKGWFART